jgi:hypothetical protein
MFKKQNQYIDFLQDDQHQKISLLYLQLTSFTEGTKTIIYDKWKSRKYYTTPQYTTSCKSREKN